MGDFPKSLDHRLVPTLLMVDAAVAVFEAVLAAGRSGRTRSRGKTLRPGTQTPLWNELREQIRPLVKSYGAQAKLARVVGLPRQRINEFVTGGGQMPDAERTLQLLVWLAIARREAPRVRVEGSVT